MLHRKSFDANFVERIDTGAVGGCKANVGNLTLIDFKQETCCGIYGYHVGGEQQRFAVDQVRNRYAPGPVAHHDV